MFQKYFGLSNIYYLKWSGKKYFFHSLVPDSGILMSPFFPLIHSVYKENFSHFIFY